MGATRPKSVLCAVYIASMASWRRRGGPARTCVPACIGPRAPGARGLQSLMGLKRGRCFLGYAWLQPPNASWCTTAFIVGQIITVDGGALL